MIHNPDKIHRVYPIIALNHEGLSEKIGMAPKIAIFIAKMNSMMLLTMRF